MTMSIADGRRPTPGSRATEADLQEHVAARLASFKVPVRVWFRDEPLPRNRRARF
jgi:long-chain acyl-CoA synthetase